MAANLASLIERTRRPQAIGLSIISLCGLVAAYATVRMAGTKTGAALALLSTAGPIVIYAALMNPVAFPFSAYVLLTPFDSILDMPQFGTVTRLLGMLSGAALLFYMLRTKRFLEPPKATALWLLLFLWMAASMFWALDLPTAQGLLAISLQLFGLYLVASMLRLRLPQLRLLLGAAAAGGVGSAFYGLYMWKSGEGMFKDRLFIHTDTSSLNPDHFAASLLTPLLICLIAAIWSRSILVRIASVAGLVIIGATIGLTGSRGAELGLAIALVYVIWRDPHRVWIALTAVALAVATLGFAGVNYFMQRWSIAAATGGAGRASIWHTGFQAFKENWLFGAGYGSFPFAYDHVFITTFQPDNAHWHRASHNIFLGTAVELGVIGLILLLLAWWGQFRLLSRIAIGDARFPARLALEASLVGLFVCGMFADIMIEKYVWLAFMLVVLTHNTTAPERSAEPALSNAGSAAVVTT